MWAATIRLGKPAPRGEMLLGREGHPSLPPFLFIYWSHTNQHCNMQKSKASSWIIIGTALICFLAVFIVLRDVNKKDSTNNVNISDPNFIFSSQDSRPGFPVFSSAKYHFKYAPKGNFSYYQSTPDSTALFSVYFLQQVEQNVLPAVNLIVYQNDEIVTATDIKAFRTWRRANIYDNEQDSITPVTINGLDYLKSTQTDSLDSSSDYYYLVTNDFIYVFYFPVGTPIDSVILNLTPFEII